MSYPFHHTAEEAKLQESVIGDSWEQEIVASLPKNLEEQAWRLGAMTRKSAKIRSASDLLRGLLAYVLVATSFRALGAWGVIAGVADIAGTSWRDRLRKSSAWLYWLLDELLRLERQEPYPCLKKAGYEKIDLVDASQLKCVGEGGRILRFHCVYALCTQQLQQVMISSTKVVENVTNFCLQRGVIYVHDSAYGYRKPIAATCEAGAYTVTAFYPGSFPLEDGEGKDISLIPWLKGLRARERAVRSLSAFFGEGGKRYEVRVIALRRTQEQMERELRKKRKNAGKDHRKMQKETMYLAHWLLILTTLPVRDWSPQEVLSLYRARWQIEMLFKRIKQLLEKHRLRARTEETAKVTIAAILVSWILQQGVARETRSLLTNVYQELRGEGEMKEEEEEEVMQMVSEWRLQKVSVDLFRQHVQGPLTQQKVFACAPRLQRHLRDSPRKRVHQWQRVTQWLVDPEKTEKSLEAGKSRKTGSALTAALA